ncbi:hypothetical protein [Rhabdaerophilum sp. SD176]|uniref:hypothetical protein n=1 Tax=Rhabdaerophilum sp. SD176 TaxID=2983548 RepID=UPI0024DFE1B1|nr:hypothetical protein [Rhabdaerophilum sp. SD176]
MAASDGTLRRDIYRIIGWAIILPALVFWPFLSAFPGMALLGEPASAVLTAANVVLFATGFWGVAPAAAVFWLLLTAAAKARFAAGRSMRAILIGCYANLWTALYAIVAFAGR